MTTYNKIFFWTIFTLFSSSSISQEWTYERLKTYFTNNKLTSIEGFFELDDDRKYLIGILKSGSEYKIFYIAGTSEGWSEGDLRGHIEFANNQYKVKWDGSIKPGALPLYQLSLVVTTNGFNLLWPNDKPDSFKKIKLVESEFVIKKYNTRKVIKMIESPSGVFEISSLINGVLKIPLILDTGASEVSISADVALTLFKAKSIDDKDWLEGKYYRFADGSIAKSERFIIRSLKIGDTEIKDVEASIVLVKT